MKYLLFFLFLTSMLHASYIDALKLYKQQKYQASIDELQKSYSEYGDERVHLLWAKDAQKLGEIKQAMSAYERVLIINPNNAEATLALLKIYKQTKRIELALKLQKKIQTLSLTPLQQKELQKIGHITKESISMQAQASVGYDTNVNSSPDSTTFKKEESLFTRVTGTIHYTNEINKKYAHYIGADATLYYQNNIDASTYNMLLLNGLIGVGYKWKKYDFFIPLSYTKLHFLDQDLYDEIGIFPTLRFKVEKDIFTKIKLHYASRSYTSTSSLRDDTKLGLEVNGFYTHNNDIFFTTLSYFNYSANKSSYLTFIDKDVYSASFGVKHPIIYENITAKLLYKWKNTSFSSREDTQHKIDLTLTKPILKNLNLSLTNQYTTNDSDYALAKYDKYVLMLGITLRR